MSTDARTPFTFGSLYSGGGGADVGLVAAGGVPVFAVEHDAEIADVYRANLGDHIIVGDAGSVDASRLEPVDLLWVSEPCQSHSVARSKQLAARHDADLSAVTGRYIEALRPRVVIMENVPPYARSDAYRAHVALLCRLGYMVDARVINAADAGVPQTRRRLIVRAVRGSLVPNLSPPVHPWVGWYAAIEDLLPTLPESAFAPWQLARLPALLGDTLVSEVQIRAGQPFAYDSDRPSPTVSTASGHRRAFLVSNAATEYGTGDAGAADPAWSVTGESAGRVRAVLVGGDNMAQQWGKGYRGDDEPAPTLGLRGAPRALIVDGQESSGQGELIVRHGDEPTFTVYASCMPRRPYRAWLESGRVVAMTPRALARFQSVPDSYILPDRRALAARVLGNMVPPLLAQGLAEGLMEALR